MKTNWPGDQESFARVRRGGQRDPGGAGRGLASRGRGALEVGWSKRWLRARSAARSGATSSCTEDPEAITRALVEGDPRALDGREGARGIEPGADLDARRLHDGRRRRRGPWRRRRSLSSIRRRLLRVEACGICGTDARTFFNGDPKAPPPWQLGHEPVGVLEQVGPEADLPPGVTRGDRVFLGSILTCGECRVVHRGVPEPLRAPPAVRIRPVPGRVRGDRGRPADRDEEPDTAPHDLPSDLATVADPFACALNGIEQLDVRLGDTVVILGTRPDRVLAGRDGARSRRVEGVPHRRLRAIG